MIHTFEEIRRFHRRMKEPRQQITRRAEVEADDFDAGNDEVALIGELDEDAFRVRVPLMPGVLAEREQEAARSTLEARLDDVRGRFVDQKFWKGRNLIIWRRYKRSILPNVTGSKNRQCTNRDPQQLILMFDFGDFREKAIAIKGETS